MVQTVLIYSMGEVIGDGLIKLPFIAGLRAAFPDARISWCAAKGETVYAGPLKAVTAGYIDEVILNDGPTGAAALDSLPWVKPFGGRKFDLVIDTQENLRRSGVAARSRMSAGFVSAAAQARRKGWPVAVTIAWRRLLALATDGQGAPRPLILDQSRRPEGRRALLPTGPTYVGLAPGAGGQDKRWPLENYLELARRIVANGLDAGVLLRPRRGRSTPPRRARGPAGAARTQPRRRLSPT
jgi:ADP-heptose:LPS heptosyltransferase